MLNLDTHMVIFALEGALTSREEAILSRDPSWAISAIVLWEIRKLVSLGRVKRDLDHPEMEEFLSKITIFPLDQKVCLGLKRLDFKSDPADEIIAATSLVYDIPLVTRDRKLRRSKTVPLARSV